MRYPVLVQELGKERVLAICPLLDDFYAVGRTLDEALRLLGKKFMWHVLDPEIQLEVIPMKSKENSHGKNQYLQK